MRLTPLEPWIQAKIGAGFGCLLRPDLESYQLERLRQTIHLGREKSRFYARRLANAPGEIFRLSDLALFPFTTAEDLRKEGQQFLCVSQGDIQRVVTLDTSGTTGSPKRVYFTRSDQELTIDFFCHGMSTFTGAGDRVMILLPYEKTGSVGDLLATGLGRLGAVPMRYGPVRDPEAALEIMQAEKIDVLVGTPVNVLALARFWETGKKARRAKPSQVLLSTDNVPQAIVTALESIWGCTVYNHYGMTEMGLGGGVDCQARTGYHVREADLYIEIIDPQTNQPVMDGQAGEIVFTTLTRNGMPLIRYRTGDISRFLPQLCPCGTKLKTMQYIRLRNNNMVRLGEGPADELAMADLDDSLFSLPPILNFSARLTGNRHQACLNLEVVILPGTQIDWRDQVEIALDGIPVVRAARHANRLDVQVSGHEYQGVMAGSPAKRKIFDQRSRYHARNLE